MVIPAWVTVLIVGAGGSIGTYTVQFSRYRGAEVTGVDRTEKLEMLRFNFGEVIYKKTLI